MNESNKNTPSLQANFNLRGNVLEIDYKVQNTTSETIYLFNVLWDFDTAGNYVPAPQDVYAALRADGTIHFAKQILPLPKGKKVEVRIIPFVTKIEAGSEFGEKLELPLPISEYNPYSPKNQDSKEEISQTKAAFLSVQFVRESEGLEVKPAPFGDAFILWHPNLLGSIETLSSKSTAISVAVKKRLDRFDEF